MNIRAPTYKRHRFPPDIIQYAVWLYFHFNLSHRDIEDLLARRGIEVSRDSLRLWCNKFGPTYARRLRRAHRGYGDTFFIDEVFVKIQGKQQYLWRAVDQDGETDSSSRAGYASFQIARAGAAISRCACGCLQPVQSGPTSHFSAPLSGGKAQCLCVLGGGSGCMR